MTLNAVELLMVEHIQARSTQHIQQLDNSFDQFNNFHRFIKNVHIEVEEKIVFPDLIEPVWDDSKTFSETVRKIMADHKLIDTLAQNLIRWNEKEDKVLYAERLPLYYRLLVEHNEKEESDIFQRWKQLDQGVYLNASKEIFNIISSFGLDRYRDAMNLSQKELEYFLDLK